MVKILLILILLSSVTFSDTIESDLLSKKIKSFVGESVYENKRNFFDVIFEPQSSFFLNDKINVIKVVQTLKENGLLKLFFKTPKELTLHFKTSGSPIFFVKIMGDSLRNIGYYRYVTTSSNLSSSEFTWSIALTSEYATDPIVLQTQLKKVGCSIVEIYRKSATDWTYVVNMGQAILNLVQLENNKEVKLKHSLYAHWLNCSKIQKLQIKSTRRNNWYPYIAYYDASLHLLKVIKEDKKSSRILLDIPKEAQYMKIADLYTLKNVKDELILSPYGTR